MTKPKLLIAEELHEKAIDEAKKFSDVDLCYGISKEKLLEKIQNYDALVVRSGTKVTEEIIRRGKKQGKLKIIGRAGVGLDNIDVDACKKNNVAIVNSPESATFSVSELVFGSLICLMRNILNANKSLREGKWERSKLVGNELRGKTLGIIGFGRIGKDIAIKGKAFHMNLLTYDPLIKKEDALSYETKLVDLDFLLEHADIITLHVPLNENTRNLIDKEKIEKLKKSAIIMNFSRGGIIDEDALYNALKKKKIKGAVLDVYKEEPPKNSPLLNLDNVVLTPHLGASTYEAQESASLVVVEKVKEYIFFKKRKIEKKWKFFQMK